MVGFETQRAAFAEDNLMIAAQRDAFRRHQPFVIRVMLVFTQHHRRIQTAYFVLQHPVRHQLAAEVKDVRLGFQHLPNLAHVADAHQNRPAGGMAVGQRLPQQADLFFFRRHPAFGIRIVGQVKRIKVQRVGTAIVGRHGDVQHPAAAEGRAAHGNHAVFGIGFAADDAPVGQHADGALHLRQRFQLLRQEHALVAHRADNRALRPRRYVFAQTLAADKFHHCRHRRSGGLFLHDNNHLPFPIVCRIEREVRAMVAQIRQNARLDRGRLKIRFAAQPKG